jgi:proline iminopeptidase
VEVNGTKLWIEIEGKGEPLLLLAGGPAASHLTFHPYFSALANQYQVIYLDYRGRGRSERPQRLGEITFDQDVADIEGLREALGLERMHVYGFSYGGLVAQGYALAHPERVAKMILANTLHSPEMWQRNHENINRELANQFPEVWERIVALRALGFRSTDPYIRELYSVHRELVRFYNPDNARRLLSEPGSHNAELYPLFVGYDIEFFIGGQAARIPDFRPRLRELRMPLLVIAGRYDRALYPSYQMEFKRHAPRAELVMMERSGSFSHIEEPEEVLALVRRFLGA